MQKSVAFIYEIKGGVQCDDKAATFLIIVYCYCILKHHDAPFASYCLKVAP